MSGRTAWEYDLFLPLFRNDGAPVSETVLQSIRERVVERFGGVTHFRSRNEGLWRLGDVTYRDEVTLLRILTTDREGGSRWLRDFSQTVRRELEQESILCLEREVRLL